MCACGMRTKWSTADVCYLCAVKNSGWPSPVFDAFQAYLKRSPNATEKWAAVQRHLVSKALKREVPVAVILRHLRDRKWCVYGTLCKEHNCGREHEAVDASKPPAAGSGGTGAKTSAQAVKDGKQPNANTAPAAAGPTADQQMFMQAMLGMSTRLDQLVSIAMAKNCTPGAAATVVAPTVFPAPATAGTLNLSPQQKQAFTAILQQLGL